MKIGSEETTIAERKKLSIPARYKEKRLWSYSRVSEYQTCKHCYYLDRICKCQKHDNIYSLLGNLAHEINEEYYTHHIALEQMIDIFDAGVERVKDAGYRFAKDADKNLKMFSKYYNCVSHFYRNFKPVQVSVEGENASYKNAKIIREKEVYADIGGNIFLGYIDQLHKENGFLVVTDDKTSGMYDKKKMESGKAQLLVYGLALIQAGIAIDKIKLRWHFIKYVNVSYLQKNGKTKTMKCERHEWVARIRTNLKSQLKEIDYSDSQIEDAIAVAIEANSLELLPKKVQDKYTFENCYVYVEVNTEVVSKFKEDMCRQIQEIERSEEKGEVSFQRDKIQDQDSYWCGVLCGVNNHCKYYKQYLDEINTFRNNEDREDGMYGETSSQSLDDEIAAMLELL